MQTSITTFVFSINLVVVNACRTVSINNDILYQPRPVDGEGTQVMTQTKLWAYTEATSKIPEVRKNLLALKRAYIKAKHYRQNVKKGEKTGKDVTKDTRLWFTWRKTAQDRLAVLNKIGVTVYHSPFHGVALFSIKVLRKDKLLDAYFVYYDSRETIDDFILQRVVEKKDKLHGATKPIPERWMNEQTPYSY